MSDEWEGLRGERSPDEESVEDHDELDRFDEQTAATLAHDSLETAPREIAVVAQDTAFLKAIRGLPVAEMATIAPGQDDGSFSSASSEPIDGLAARCETKYRVGRVLGRGGMGLVRRTRDEHLQRHVAMKTLRDGATATASMAGILVREARLTGQLEHPNIVPVYDLGTLENGEFFYTMRLYREFTLGTILDGLRKGDPEIARAYDEEALLQVFRQMCMAVAYAHSRGVVHRDIKPGNVLVGDYGEVLLTDWGVAQVTPGATVSAPPLRVISRGGVSAEGTPLDLVGTPRYMAPEQIDEPSHVNPRSDIYSLGVILYELTTLGSPYADTENLHRLIDDVRHGRIIPPDERNPERVVPARLAAICTRALALDPEDRYESARSLWKAVEQYLTVTLRRKRAAELARAEVERGRNAAERYFEIQKQRKQLGERIGEMQSALRGWHPLSEKRRVWDLRDQRDRLEIALAKAFSEANDHYLRAITHEPDNRAARNALALLYWSKLEPAVERGDFENTVYFGDLVRRLSEPRVGPLREGSATLSIRTLPEGALVWLHGIATLDPNTMGRRGEPLGAAPLMDIQMPSGVYIAVARADGYREARAAVLLQAGDNEQLFLSLPSLHEDRPMAGRDAELGRLKALYESARENRSPRFALVHAPQGMGKAKLMDAFEEYLAGLPETIFLFYAEPRRTHRQLPFAPLTDLIAFRAGIKAEDDCETRERKLLEMVRLAVTRNHQQALTPASRLLVEETAEDLGLLPGLVGPPKEERGGGARQPGEFDAVDIRRRIFAGLTAYFGWLGRWHTFYLRIGSAHRLDSSTLAALHHLKEALPDTPLYCVAISSEAEPRERLASVCDTGVRLWPLDELGVERFVASYLDGPVSRELVTTLHTLSEGCPDHIDVLLPLLTGQGLITQREGRWIVVDGARIRSEGLSYEDAVNELVYGPLSASQKELLSRAAVAGRLFSGEEVQALGVSDPGNALTALIERQVILHRPTAGVLWTEIYAFVTDTVHRIAYESIPEDARRELHLRLARHLASLPDPPPEGLALLANHYRHGGRHDLAIQALHRLEQHALAFGGQEEAELNRALAQEIQRTSHPGESP